MGPRRESCPSSRGPSSGVCRYQQAAIAANTSQPQGARRADDARRANTPYRRQQRLKQPGLFLCVGDEQVLRLLVVVEHHEVVFAPDAGLLISTESGMRRVGVVLVDPHATSLNGAPGTVGGVAVARPHTGTESVDGVVGDGDGLIKILKGSYRQDGAEDLLLEDTHVVGAFEHGGFDVEAVFQPGDSVDAAAGKYLGAFFWAEFEVGLDLVHLLDGCLRTHLDIGVERVAGFDLLDAFDACLLYTSDAADEQ